MCYVYTKEFINVFTLVTLAFMFCSRFVLQWTNKSHVFKNYVHSILQNHREGGKERKGGDRFEALKGTFP